MIASLMDVFFGCWHKRYSFPITTRSGQRRPAAQVTGTYIVCLDCGQEFPYDWEEMRVIRPGRSSVARIVEAARTYAE